MGADRTVIVFGDSSDEMLDARMQLEVAQNQAKTYKEQAERAVQARLDAEIAHARQAADEQRENIASAAAASRPLLVELKSERKREADLEAELEKSQTAQARLKEDAEKALASANAAMTKSEKMAQRVALLEKQAKDRDASWARAASSTLEILRKDRLDESQQWDKLRHGAKGKRPSLLLETQAGTSLAPTSPNELLLDLKKMAENAHAARLGNVNELHAQEEVMRSQIAETSAAERSSKDFESFRNTLDSMDLDVPVDVSKILN